MTNGNSVSTSIDLQAVELTEAEQVWIRSVQKQVFYNEIRFLRHKTYPQPVTINQFGLYLDEKQIIRCKARINNSTLSADSKNPVLLLKKDPSVRLLIEYVHKKTLHSGVRDTLTALREQYWIMKGRQEVCQVIRSCAICKRVEGNPYTVACSPVLEYQRILHSPILG